MRELTVVILLLSVGGCVRGGAAWYVPSSEEPVREYSQLSKNLMVETWIMRTKSPPIISAYVRIECKDSVFLDMPDPRFHTAGRRMAFDALSMWRIIDTATGEREGVALKSRLEEGVARGAKLALDEGVYLLQAIIFQGYHENFKVSNVSLVCDLGQIRAGDDVISLEGVTFDKIEIDSPSFGVPPAGSKIR